MCVCVCVCVCVGGGGGGGGGGGHHQSSSDSSTSTFSRYGVGLRKLRANYLNVMAYDTPASCITSPGRQQIWY